MRKNGFTLIELLAVIVILAIIALIATPIILGIINDAREESNERSVELYAAAVKNGIAAYQLRQGKEIKPDTYTKETLPFTVDYDGNVECTSIIISEDSKVSLDGCKVNNGEKEYSYGIEEQEDTSGDVETPDVVAKLCTANTTKATALVWDGLSDPGEESAYATGEVGLLASDGDAFAKGVAYTCNFIDDNETNNMTFFVLSSTEDTVTLISGANLGGRVAWSEDGNNHKDDPEEMQAVTSKAALADRTSTWGKLTDEQKSTIKLPTKNQIESAYEGTMPKWLKSHTTTPVAHGYWTSTPDAEDSLGAWCVGSYGVIDSVEVDGNDGHGDSWGVRPVITLSKSQI